MPRRILERIIVGVCVALAMTFFYGIKKAYAYPPSTTCTFTPSNGSAQSSLAAALSELVTPAAPRTFAYWCTEANNLTCDSSGGVGGGAGAPVCDGTTNAKWAFVCSSQTNPACIFQGFVTVAPVSSSCPNGGTLVSGNCQCPSGQTDNGTGCVGSVSCEWPKYDNGSGTCVCSGVNAGFGGPGGQDTIANSSYGGGGIPVSWSCSEGSAGTRPTTSCVAGCTFNLNYPGITVAQRVGTTCSTEVALSNANHTGTPCSGGSPAPSPTDPPLNCPQGMVKGTVNGVERCLPGNTQGAGGGSTNTTTTLEDGTVVEKDISTEKITNCSGPGSCSTTITTTTTTTVTAPGKTPTTTTEETTETRPGDGTELGGFCEQNPGSPICKSSSWSGACASVACEGDAIQCAIAREQHKRNCELFDNQDLPENGAGDKPTQTDTDIGSQISAVASASGRWGAACPADFNVTIGDGTNFTVKMSDACVPLQLLGFVLLGLTALWSYMIVAEGVR